MQICRMWWSEGKRRSAECDGQRENAESMMVRGQKCRSAEYGGQRSFWLGNNRQRMTDKAFFFFLPSYLFIYIVGWVLEGGCTCLSVEVKGQLLGFGSFLLRRVSGHGICVISSDIKYLYPLSHCVGSHAEFLKQLSNTIFCPEILTTKTQRSLKTI